MHSLNDVSAIVENSLDVFRVYRTGKVRIAVVLAVATRRRYTQKFISDEIFCSNHFRIFAHFTDGISRRLVTVELTKVVGKFAFGSLNFLRQQILLIEEQYYGYCS